MTWLQDVAHAGRRLRREPMFAAAAVVMLALAIGLASAMFSVVNSVFLRPLPYDHSEQVVAVSATDAHGGHPAAALPDFEALQARARRFQSLAAYSHRFVNLTGIDRPERLQALAVSAAFFDVLRQKPALGRPFLPQDEVWGRHRVAILTDSFWRDAFAADRAVLGRTITLDGEPYIVVGVLPPGFWFLDEADRVLVPLAFAPDDNRRTRANHFLAMIGRLEPGTTVAAASADATAVAKGLAREDPSMAGLFFTVARLQDVVVSNVRLAMVVLGAAVAMLLLLGCLNLTGIVLARSMARRKEVAVQAALGASRLRLTRECLVEGVLLAVPGGVLGSLLAVWASHIVRSINPAILPRAAAVHIDASGWLFVALLSTVAALVVGTAPAMGGGPMDLTSALNGEGRGDSAGRTRVRVRTLLVVAQTALALVLLGAGGVMLRSVLRLTHVELGFDPDHVLTFGVNLPADRYLDPSVHPPYAPEATRKVDEYLREALLRLRRVPGVRAAGATALLPASGIGWDKVATLWDRPLPRSIAQLPPFEYRPVAGDYFAAMGIRVIQGRALNDLDTMASPLVAVVNEEFVKRNFGGRDSEAIGTRVSVNPPKRLLPPVAISPDSPETPPQFTIVGVVADARNAGIDQPTAPMIYCPYSQGAEDTLTMSFGVRTAGDPLTVLPGVRRAMWLTDNRQPLAHIRTMDDALAASIGRPRVETEMLATFGMAALALAALGIYALVAFAVAQRTREIGIRIALGAHPRALAAQVVGRAAQLAIAGALLGSMVAAMLMPVMRSMLFGVGAFDPVVFAAAGGLLVVTAVAAASLPARRAAHVDPVIALGRPTNL